MNPSNEHLLIILDQIALIADLEPAAQMGFYSLQTLRQINGSFINSDQQLNTTNLTKVLNKLDPHPYQLILPDKLFFDAIFSVPSVEDEEIKNYINNEILPEQPISFDTHQIQTSFLLQLKESCRIQISAASLELLQQIGQCVKDSKAQISSVTPLTWLTKSMITMEPSLSLVEINQNIYFGQHYIGISNTIEFHNNELDDLIATIQDAREYEPNLQIAYLLTENQTENHLKKNLKNILPLQQLASGPNSEDGIAAAVRAYLEIGARTLQIAEFATPKYEPIISNIENIDLNETETPEDLELNSAAASVLIVEETTVEDETFEIEEIPDETEEIMLEFEPESDFEVENFSDDTDDTLTLEQKVETMEINQEGEIKYEATTTKISSSIDDLGDQQLDAELGENLNQQEIGDIVVPHPTAHRIPNHITSAAASPNTIITRQKHDSNNIDSAQLARSQANPPAISEDTFVAAPVIASSAPPPPTTPNTEFATPPAKPIANSRLKTTEAAPVIKRAAPIQNSITQEDEPLTEDEKVIDDYVQPSATQRVHAKPNKIEKESSFGKKVLIFLLIFILTVGAGLALGFGLLNVLDKQSSPEQTPTPAPVIATPEPTPEPVATDSALENKVETKINRAEQKIQVVNATGVAGLAGKIKTKLEAAGYKNVATGNATDKYDPEDGNLAVMTDSNSALLADLKEASGLTLSNDQSHSKKENPDSKYDAVIVINDKDI